MFTPENPYLIELEGLSHLVFAFFDCFWWWPLDYQQYIYYFDETNRVNGTVFCTVAGRPCWCLQEPKSSNQKFCRSVGSTARLLRATEGTRQHQHVLLFVFSSLGQNRSMASGFRLQRGKGALPVRNHPSTGDRRRPLANAAVLEQTDTLLLHQDPQDRKYPEEGMVVTDQFTILWKLYFII